MNAHIEKLAREAGFEFAKDWGINAVSTQDLMIERFAKAIAEDCAKGIDENGMACEQGSVMRFVLLSNANAIRERYK